MEIKRAAPGFWRLEQSTHARTHMLQWSRVKLLKTKLPDTKKEKRTTTAHANHCLHPQACNPASQAASQSTVALAERPPPPHLLTYLTLFVRRGRTEYVRAPAAVIASHRHQSPTALFLARPLPSPSTIAAPSPLRPAFRLSRSHHSCCVHFLSRNAVSRKPPSQRVSEVNGLRQPLAAVSRPLRGKPSPHTGTVGPYCIPDDKTNTRVWPRVASRPSIPRRLGAATCRLSLPSRQISPHGGPQPPAEAPL